MLQVFGTADDLKASFNSDISAGFTVIMFMAALAILFAWFAGRKRYWKPTAVLALAGCILIAWNAYATSYARFFEAQVRGTQLTLRFAGPLAKEISLPAQAVETVLSGSPGKSNRQCYLRIVLKSGGSYRSALLDQEFAACKSRRQDLLEALNRQ